jgi:hypothetical protein
MGEMGGNYDVNKTENKFIQGFGGKTGGPTLKT